MARTQYGVNAPETVKLWSMRLFREAIRKTQINKFIGNDPFNVIQRIDDTEKYKGDRIRNTLLVQLEADGVVGDESLEGNEEALSTFTDDIFINQLRNAVRSGGRMTEQRIPYEIRENAYKLLVDWWAQRFDTVAFNHLVGNTGETRVQYNGNNSITAPDSNHIIYASDHTTETSVNGDTNAVFTLDLIDHAVEKARTLTDNPIRPLRMNGHDYYCIFLHSYQITSLRTSTATGQWQDIQKSAMQGGKVDENPIFTGAHGVYNGVIIHETSYIPASPNLTSTRRAVLCGAQAASLAFGNNYSLDSMNWVEEFFDYQNQLGVSAGMIYGLKKNVFNSEDFGTIVIPTYAVAAT